MKSVVPRISLYCGSSQFGSRHVIDPIFLTDILKIQSSASPVPIATCAGWPTTEGHGSRERARGVRMLKSCCQSVGFDTSSLHSAEIGRRRGSGFGLRMTDTDDDPVGPT